ncbi:MAG TPA: isomerase [Chitinophagaceae bacterium]|jgi:PhzF family phenazine biosynthesis protein|nr:isomerase [Chitinophagaceae bacterium]
MKVKIYIANAFSEIKFGGNPAAVVPLDDWLTDYLMQQIAAQNNLSETAYIVPRGDYYGIRWFTPAVEVDLCGHATLASAHVLFRHLGYERDLIRFHSKSGLLRVTRRMDGRITLDFPVNEPVETSDDGLIERALGVKPRAVYKSLFDYMVVLDSQQQIEALKPGLDLVKKLPARGLIVTARGEQADFVSRCFFPQSGIDEDPVTGSAHCVMVPYWARETGKTKFSAIQLSVRRGYLDCELSGDRVLMSGHAHTYLEGDFYY